MKRERMRSMKNNQLKHFLNTHIYTVILCLCAAQLYPLFYQNKINISGSKEVSINSSFPYYPQYLTNINNMEAHELFRQYDKDHKKDWPKGGVCLMLRSYFFDFVFLNRTFASVEMFWPYNIGKKIIVLDIGEEYLINQIPPQWTVYFEKFEDPIGNDGYVGKQWSNMVADRYCDEEFIAVTDSDLIMQTKVTPDLIFNNDGKPFMQFSEKFQVEYLWYDNPNILKIKDWVNGMTKLPFVIRRDDVIGMRNYIERIHGKKLPVVLETYRNFSQCCLFATYVYHEKNPNYQYVIFEKTDPTVQYGVHLPYCVQLKSPRRKNMPKFIRRMDEIMDKAICQSFPKDRAPFCKKKHFDELYYWNYDFVYFNHSSKDILERVSDAHFKPLHQYFGKIGKQ